MQHATEHAGQTPYWTYNDPGLPPIVMIHGYRGTHHGLDLIAKELKEFYVIVPDLPGFGDAKPLESEHSLDGYVTWLNQFIKDLGLKTKPALLGHSFGSIICSHFVAAHSKSITKLILVNPISAPALAGPKKVMTQLAIFYYWLGRQLPKPIAKAWLQSKIIVMVMSTTMAKTKNKQLRRYIHDQHRRYFSNFANAQSVSEAFITSVTFTAADAATRITVPTLLIAGERDDITPISKQYKLLNLLPHGKLHIIPGVGHLTHYETPKEVAGFVQAFMTSV